MTSRAKRLLMRWSFPMQAALTCAVLVCIAGKAHAAERWIDEPTPPTIHVEISDIDGPVYADARGMTIYRWGRDPRGKSLCNADHYGEVEGGDGVGGSKKYVVPDADHRPTCEQVWMPLRPAADSAPVGKWSIIKRNDGSPQWAHEGKALYTSVYDNVPGAVNGMGKDAPMPPGNRGAREPLTPRLANPDGVVTQIFPQWGRVLRTGESNVLYVKSAKTTKESERAFAPFLAPDLAQPLGDWTMVALKEGGRQWAYQGKPLYYPVIDKSRVEERPDLVHGRTTWDPVRMIAEDTPGWSPVIVQRAPKPPAAVTIERTAAGDLLADAHGRTLYAFNCTEPAPDALSCDTPGSSPLYRYPECGGPDTCAEHWRLLEAAPNAKAPNHTWSIASVDKKTGRFAQPGDSKAQRVWLYRGRPLYTFWEDAKPGDLRGQYVNADGWDYYFLSLVSTSSNYDPSVTQ